MDLFNTAKQYTEQIGGQFSTYDSTKAIIIVPLEQGRFQTVILTLEKNKNSDNQLAIFTAKVCELTPAVNLAELLEHNALHDYSKFVLDGSFLKVVAAIPNVSVSENDMKDLLQGVASLADAYELRLTGKDIQ